MFENKIVRAVRACYSSFINLSKKNIGSDFIYINYMTMFHAVKITIVLNYNKLSDIEVVSSETVFSLDVVSLFTNIPLNLALEIWLSNRWEYIELFTTIPKIDFMHMTKFLFNSTFFTFNKTIYRQSYSDRFTSLTNYRRYRYA